LKIKNKNQENDDRIKKNKDYGSKNEIENKLKFDKRLKIKIKNQNIEGQTLNIYKKYIKLKIKIKFKKKFKKKKQRKPIFNELNDDG
jgi:hypothetical protein